MQFLPIVERELRVASMSRKQFRLRMLIAFVTIMAGMFALLSFADISRAGGNGRSVFGLFTVSFGLICWFSGVFLTADCISREKREGTLGLLFLTDLNGRDVVLGKLASSSIVTFYTVLSAMPVLAMTFLMGGITGTEMMRTGLVLIMTMFLSLSTGMMVSTFSQKSNQAGQVTFFLMLLWTFVPILVPSLLDPSFGPAPGASSWGDLLVTVSPIGLARATRSPFAVPFYTGVALMFALGVAQLAVASFFVRRTWQNMGARPVSRRTVRRRALHSRSRVLDQSPVEWLAGGRGSRNLVPVAMFCVAVAVLFYRWPSEMNTVVPVLAVHVLPYLLALFIASRATIFFLGLRQNGSMELILSTPLTDKDIVSGQWAVLRHRYFAFAVFIIALIWLPVSDWQVYPNFDSYHGDADKWIALLVAKGYVTLRSLLLWFTAGWAGMYFALHSRNILFVRLKTFVIGVILPWVVFCIPEPFITVVVLAVCQSGVTESVRSTVLQRLENSEAE